MNYTGDMQSQLNIETPNPFAILNDNVEWWNHYIQMIRKSKSKIKRDIMRYLIPYCYGY